MKTKRGMTLLEIMLVVAVLGFIAALVLPRLGNVMPFVHDTDAVSRAVTLNSAIFTYSKRVPGASTAWTAADNAGKYALLSTAGYLPGCPSTLAGFQPSGYSFTLPTTLSNPRVVITGPNGVVTYN